MQALEEPLCLPGFPRSCKAHQDVIQIEENILVMCSAGGAYLHQCQARGLTTTGKIATAGNSRVSARGKLTFAQSML
jgi:hypothetical protein